MLSVLKVYMVQKREGKPRGKMFPESYQVQPHRVWLSKSLSSSPLAARTARQEALHACTPPPIYALLALTGHRVVTAIPTTEGAHRINSQDAKTGHDQHFLFMPTLLCNSETGKLLPGVPSYL